MIKCIKGHYYDNNLYSQCPFCGNDTESGNEGQRDKEPVGELECIFGDSKGKRYKLHSGLNRIGKSYQMDVCIDSDLQIVRDNHCSILYDEKKKVFVLMPSAGSLTYMNNVVLERPTVIGKNDVFRIGRSDLKLVGTKGVKQESSDDGS